MAASRGLLRLLDANLNRAREALRVCEDVLRFALTSRAQFRRMRQLRYALNAAARKLPVAPRTLVEARDSRADAGRRSRPSASPSCEHVLLINLQRAKEALRVLEEGSRMIGPAPTRAFQDLRFRVYDAERAILISLAPVRHRRPRRRRSA